MNNENCRIYRLFENNPSECEWKMKGEIGSGKQAHVYNICCNNEEKCDYVVKIYDEPYPSENAFNNEVEVHYALTKLKLAVPIVEAFYCKDHGSYIIMEKRDMDVQQYINKLIENRMSDEFIRGQIEKLRKDCVYLVMKAYDNYYEHRDANINNFVLDMIGNDYNNIAMIDFAHTYYIGKDEDGKVPDMKRNEKEDDVNKTIDLLIKYYEEKIRKKNDNFTSFKGPPAINKRTKYASSVVPNRDDIKRPRQSERLSFDTISSTTSEIPKSNMLLFDDIKPLNPTVSYMSSFDDIYSSDNNKLFGGSRYKSPIKRKEKR